MQKLFYHYQNHNSKQNIIYSHFSQKNGFVTITTIPTQSRKSNKQPYYQEKIENFAASKLE